MVPMDDATITSAALARLLASEGYLPAIADGGEQGLALVAEAPPDLVVTDLNMPVLDGRELIRRVAASPKLSGMPVMVVTSSGNQARKDELLSMGAVVVLRKPINPMAIGEGLEAVLALEES